MTKRAAELVQFEKKRRRKSLPSKHEADQIAFSDVNQSERIAQPSFNKACENS